MDLTFEQQLTIALVMGAFGMFGGLAVIISAIINVYNKGKKKVDDSTAASEYAEAAEKTARTFNEYRESTERDMQAMKDDHKKQMDMVKSELQMVKNILDGRVEIIGEAHMPELIRAGEAPLIGKIRLVKPLIGENPT